MKYNKNWQEVSRSLDLLLKLGQEIVPVNCMFLKYQNASLIQLRVWAKKHCKLLQFLLRIGFTCIVSMLGLKHHRTVGGEFYGHDWQCKCQIKQSGYRLHRKYHNHRNNMVTRELNGSGKSERATRPKHDAVSCSAGRW